MLNALSPVRRRFFGAVAALVSIGVVAAVIALVVSRDPDVDPVAQGDLGPVLLVPGYGGSTASLEALSAALENAGRETVVVGLADGGTGDLRAQAEVLGNAADEAMDRTGATSVDVVGYSAGGVIARLWVVDLGGGNIARRVLTLGSPQHGTDLASLAVDVAPDRCPTACRQLATDSDLLRRLNAGDETPDGPLWVSIYTTQDDIVVPAKSAELEGALNFSVQSVCGDARIEHRDLPRDPAVITMTLDELALEPPTPPTSEVC